MFLEMMIWYDWSTGVKNGCFLGVIWFVFYVIWAMACIFYPYIDKGRGKHETMPILVKVGIGIFLTKTPRYFEKGNVAAGADLFSPQPRSPPSSENAALAMSAV